jgi:hypothetical protein
MNIAQARNETRVAKWGWGILIVVSALLALNGLGWFFAGPNSSLSSIAQETGMSAPEFTDAYPAAVSGIEANARQVAIWYMAFGLLALLVAVEGYRHGSRWAWNSMWVLVAVSAAIAALELAAGGAVFGFAMLGLAAVTLVGQLLARGGLAS